MKRFLRQCVFGGIVFVLSLLLAIALALAAPVTKTVQIMATEPSLNADGSPLTDLAGLIFGFDLSTHTPSTIYTSPLLPAQSPQGGKEVLHTMSLTFDPAKVTGSRRATFWAEAVDTSGNHSERVTLELGLDDFILKPGKVITILIVLP